MDAVEFFQTVNRICKNKDCNECPVYKNDMCCMVGFDYDSIRLKALRKQFRKSSNGRKTIPSKPVRASF